MKKNDNGVETSSKTIDVKYMSESQRCFTSKKCICEKIFRILIVSFYGFLLYIATISSLNPYHIMTWVCIFSIMSFVINLLHMILFSDVLYRIKSVKEKLILDSKSNNGNDNNSNSKDIIYQISYISNKTAPWDSVSSLSHVRGSRFQKHYFLWHNIGCTAAVSIATFALFDIHKDKNKNYSDNVMISIILFLVASLGGFLMGNFEIYSKHEKQGSFNKKLFTILHYIGGITYVFVGSISFLFWRNFDLTSIMLTGIMMLFFITWNVFSIIMYKRLKNSKNIVCCNIFDVNVNFVSRVNLLLEVGAAMSAVTSMCLLSYELGNMLD